ncbi:MAG: gamma-glutamyl-gamma-aminobutyrate hydrolase family protein [Clostridia bacterium]|nr:gamma-glutamyl-gamma-aminobutyrate hydrolase family protein [Clostridia bacterium]
MKKPIVAVTPSTENNGRYHVSVPYFDVLEKAGVLPVLLPMHPGDTDFNDIVTLFDGFLFAGGCDVSPAEFGEEILPECGEIQPDRDRLEILLFREVIKQKKPCFAICRGVQVINVAAGGSLFQDIPAQYKHYSGNEPLKHSQDVSLTEPTHHVSVKEGTKLFDITGSSDLFVNSHHHQSVKDVADMFKVTAVSDDGVIEAVESDEMPFCVGVQWHPEQLAVSRPEQMKLFEAFAKACGRRER